ncbi:MAG: hypothetical protein U0235_00560 [Polyangiaceae bacterium]
MSADRIRASIEAYIAAWNEPDSASRAQLLERACADDLVVRTGGKRMIGRGELDALIVDFQRRRPGNRAVLASVVDVQGGLFRYAGVVEAPTRARRRCFRRRRVRRRREDPRPLHVRGSFAPEHVSLARAARFASDAHRLRSGEDASARARAFFVGACRASMIRCHDAASLLATIVHPST